MEFTSCDSQNTTGGKNKLIIPHVKKMSVAKNVLKSIVVLMGHPLSSASQQFFLLTWQKGALANRDNWNHPIGKTKWTLNSHIHASPPVLLSQLVGPKGVPAQVMRERVRERKMGREGVNKTKEKQGGIQCRDLRQQPIRAVREGEREGALGSMNQIKKGEKGDGTGEGRRNK